MNNLVRHIFRKGRKIRLLAALPAIATMAFLVAASAPSQASAAPAAGARPASVSGQAPSTTAHAGPEAKDPFSLLNGGNTSLCLGINSSGDAGDWGCTYANDQAWHQGAEWSDSGYYQVINADGQCLGVAGASTTENARVVGFTCIASHPDQYWGFYPEGNGYYAVQDLHSGDSLSVSGRSTANGAAVVQWPYQGQANQLWYYYSY